ncbi:AIG2 family protein [Klebsiella pneumoniae]|nr:AIG2 family protein [Klebsiella pneumoniae]
MKPLFVYGTLCPGRSNAHILEAIGGEWRPGYVTGTFYARGWGAAADFPGIVLDAHGPRVNGYLFLSDRLAAHWPMLDDFEEGYDRVPVEVTTDDGQQISAGFISFSPGGNPPPRCAAWYSSPARSRVWRRFCQCRYTCQMFPQFQHADDKTHLTRADAQSRPGQQQKNG